MKKFTCVLASTLLASSALATEIPGWLDRVYEKTYECRDTGEVAYKIHFGAKNQYLTFEDVREHGVLQLMPQYSYLESQGQVHILITPMSMPGARGYSVAVSESDVKLSVSFDELDCNVAARQPATAGKLEP